MKKNPFNIGPYQIGPHSLPFFIAEAGVNHNGNLETAYQLIEAAKEIGAHAIKFQSFKAKNLALPSTPKVPYQLKSAPKEHESHFDMLKKLEMDDQMTKKVKTHCDHVGILFLSTPYDPQAVEQLAELGVHALKVASADLIDFRIHKAIQKTGLPLIQGLGMSTEDEIEQLVKMYDSHNPKQQIVLLQCTSNYPASPINSNIRFLQHLPKLPQIFAGFSDHTPNSESAVLALALGAKVFEKHFTLDKNAPGPDHKASCEPEGMKCYFQDILRAEKVLGDGIKKVADEESDMRRISRKGAYLRKDLKKGDLLKIEDIDFIRPANDLPMWSIYPHINQKACKDLKKSTQLNPKDFKASSI